MEAKVAIVADSLLNYFSGPLRAVRTASGTILNISATMAELFWQTRFTSAGSGPLNIFKLLSGVKKGTL